MSSSLGVENGARGGDKYTNLNKRLLETENDYFYHLYLEKTEDLKDRYGDVKFVCMGGQSKRMLRFANYMKDLLKIELPVGATLNDITKQTDRYSMFKVGPCLFVNHGIGCPSLSVIINELLKLLFYAECSDVTFFRIGTCGGIGVPPGTVILTETAVDGIFRPEYRQYILGKEVVRPAKCHQQVHADLMEVSERLKSESATGFDIVSGKTLCVNDFYEDQARLDGIFCHYSNDEKQEFMQKCVTTGITNIEMESLGFAGLLNHAGVKFGICCVTLLDRLKSDQPPNDTELLAEFQQPL
jgi:uridine phosphorylase